MFSVKKINKETPIQKMPTRTKFLRAYFMCHFFHRHITCVFFVFFCVLPLSPHQQQCKLVVSSASGLYNKATKVKLARINPRVVEVFACNNYKLYVTYVWLCVCMYVHILGLRHLLLYLKRHLSATSDLRLRACCLISSLCTCYPLIFALFFFSYL